MSQLNLHPNLIKVFANLTSTIFDSSSISIIENNINGLNLNNKDSLKQHPNQSKSSQPMQTKPPNCQVQQRNSFLNQGNDRFRSQEFQQNETNSRPSAFAYSSVISESKTMSNSYQRNSNSASQPVVNNHQNIRRDDLPNKSNNCI